MRQYSTDFNRSSNRWGASAFLQCPAYRKDEGIALEFGSVLAVLGFVTQTEKLRGAPSLHDGAHKLSGSRVLTDFICTMRCPVGRFQFNRDELPKVPAGQDDFTT